MSPLPFPQDSTDTAAATSATSATTSATPSSTSGAGSVGNSGSTPASATLLFGFLIIFVALFSAFLLLGFLWQFQRRRRAAQATLLLEFDENGRSYGDGVPKLWEVWIQDEPNHWEWENIRPLSVDVGHTTSSGPGTTAVSTRMRLRLSWLRNPFHRRTVPSPQPQQQQPASPLQSQSPPEAPQQQQQQQQQPDDAGAEAPAALISGVRTSFVIAMPYADAPNRRRSAISQVSSMGENWRRRDYAIGIYHPPFREGFAL